MIGTALSQKEQLNLLNKLDKCDVPWNCAHGRVSWGDS
jgi:DNA mismatch repair ATPase MutL